MDNVRLAEQTRFLTSNGEERFYCPLCRNVRYTHVRYLKSHIKECGQQFVCHLCKNIYKQKRTYVSHLRTKHNLDQHQLNEELKQQPDQFKLNESNGEYAESTENIYKLYSIKEIHFVK